MSSSHVRTVLLPFFLHLNAFCLVSFASRHFQNTASARPAPASLSAMVTGSASGSSSERFDVQPSLAVAVSSWSLVAQIVERHVPLHNPRPRVLLGPSGRLLLGTTRHLCGWRSSAGFVIIE